MEGLLRVCYTSSHDQRASGGLGRRGCMPGQSVVPPVAAGVQGPGSSLPRGSGQAGRRADARTGGRAGGERKGRLSELPPASCPTGLGLACEIHMA